MPGEKKKNNQKWKPNTKAPEFVFDNCLVYVKPEVAKEHLVWTSKAVKQVA